ncbi:MAG: alkaline phosphatase family protein [Candidatus Micrarchaeota archaeon]|nr:alkaline phosphatase family protein [Candidatus Micrarchaeota archaeon]
MEKKAKRRKLYLIGVDAAPLWAILELSQKYEMKGFSRFLKGGTLNELESTLPPVTAAAWPSIYTGLEPKDHGVMDFVYLDRNYVKQLIYYDSKKNPPFWDKLAKSGVRSLILTPAMVLTLSDSKNIDMVTGWPLEPKYSSEELRKAAKKFGFRGEPEIGVDLDKGVVPIAEGSKKYCKSIKARAEMGKYLIKKNDYDLVFVCFTETDRIQHYSFNNKNWSDYIHPLYENISEFIEWVVNYSKKMGEDAEIMLVSDHGAQPIYDKFLPNAWLIKENYAKLKRDVDNETGPSSKKTQGLNAGIKDYVVDKALRWRMRRVVYQKMPDFVKKMADRIVEEDRTNMDSKGYLKISDEDIDMRQTRAFASVSFGPVGMIWINDGRFAAPGIPSSKRSALKKELMERIGKLKDREGGRLVEGVFDGGAYYKDSGSFISPDILFLLRKNYIVDFTYYSKDTLFMKPEIYRSGDHTMQGIFGVLDSGAHTRRSLIKKKMSVYDIAPLILKYFDGQ